MSEADSYKEICLALQKKLVEFNDYDFSGKISFENTDFDPQGLSQWLQEFFLFSDPRKIGAFTQGSYLVRGIYQVNVCGKRGDGTVELNAIAGSLARHFSRGVQLTEGAHTVKIEGSYRGSATADATWYKVPVSVEFWCYTSY